MDAQFVLNAADMHRLVPLHQKERQAARVVGAGLAARQHQLDVGAAVGDKSFDAVEMPFAAGLVEGGAGLYGSQVRAGIRFCQHHGAGHFAATETGQHAGFHFFAAVFVNGGGNLLQTKDSHQAGLGPRDDLHHHLIEGLGKVQTAILPRQHCPHQLGLLERLDGSPGRLGIFDLSIAEVRPFSIRLGGTRRYDSGADVAQYFEQQPVVVLGIVVVARCGRVLAGVAVPFFFNFDDFSKVQPLQAEPEIQIIQEIVFSHYVSVPNLFDPFAQGADQQG
jgi:hypothetical protein